MAGSSTKINFPQLTEKHDCDHAASATIVIILLTSARSQRAVFFRRRCSLAFMISFMSPAGRISKMLPYVSAGCSTLLHQPSGALAELLKRDFQRTKFLRAQFR